MRVDILGIGFDNISMDEAVDLADGFIQQGGVHRVVTPNPELVYESRINEDFRNVINASDLVLPDGIGIIYGSRILKRPLKERVAGIDFAQRLIERLEGKGKKLFLLGGKPGIAEIAAENLRSRYPELNICGVADGYFTDNDTMAREIRESGADVVFVCTGFPKQEFWIRNYGEKTGASLLAGLGGSIDAFAGQAKRAPAFMRKMGLEWLYRLIRQPSRIGRMMRLPSFLLAVLAARLRGE